MENPLFFGLFSWVLLVGIAAGRRGFSTFDFFFF